MWFKAIDKWHIFNGVYSGGILISGKEARECLSWIKAVFKQVDYYLTKNSEMF